VAATPAAADGRDDEAVQSDEPSVLPLASRDQPAVVGQDADVLGAPVNAAHETNAAVDVANRTLDAGNRQPDPIRSPVVPGAASTESHIPVDDPLRRRARSGATPLTDLRELAKHQAWQVRRDVASNPLTLTPPSVVHDLLGDSSGLLVP
jgi:hypothetical protein